MKLLRDDLQQLLLGQPRELSVPAFPLCQLGAVEHVGQPVACSIFVGSFAAARSTQSPTIQQRACCEVLGRQVSLTSAAVTGECHCFHGTEAQSVIVEMGGYLCIWDGLVKS